MKINEQEWREAFKGAYEGEMAFSVAMKNHVSLEIGGPADALFTPRDPLSARNLIAALGRKGIPFLMLGAGTNVLIRDSGIEGAVISLKFFDRIESFTADDAAAEPALFVEAGVRLQRLVNYCREKGYAGLEGLSGIPGTFGGAVVGNAGSFGYEIKDVIESVAIMDGRGKLDRFKAEGLGFGYRKSEISPTDIVLSANIKLRKEDRETVSRRTESFFGEKRQTQPISAKSAGCVFKNPPGVSAGSLIDRAGCKGMKAGAIEVSRVHANFFINTGGGTASDFIGLMEKVSSAVYGKFGVTLNPEIRILGRN